MRALAGNAVGTTVGECVKRWLFFAEVWGVRDYAGRYDDAGMCATLGATGVGWGANAVAAAGKPVVQDTPHIKR